ncbi:hypothetical protein JTB14_023720 [Gonioctena quinquepunctata]|nr:hypothetical protein JTB14_023720 [Gonioctena quinquepunctata]
MTEITSSDLKCEEIKDCHVGQEDEIIIHQQDAAQVDDPEINQGMQDQQENQEEIVGDDEETPTFKENLQGRDIHQSFQMKNQTQWKKLYQAITRSTGKKP